MTERSTGSKMTKNMETRIYCKMTKYVYQNIEVILTGRIAEKKLRKSVSTLYEITPLDKETGSWKKWVRITDLHEIVVDKDPPPPLTFVPKPVPPAGKIIKERDPE